MKTIIKINEINQDNFMLCIKNYRNELVLLLEAGMTAPIIHNVIQCCDEIIKSGLSFVNVGTLLYFLESRNLHTNSKAYSDKTAKLDLNLDHSRTDEELVEVLHDCSFLLYTFISKYFKRTSLGNGMGMIEQIKDLPLNEKQKKAQEKREKKAKLKAQQEAKRAA